MAVRLLLATPDGGLAAAARLHAADAGWRLRVATSTEEAVNAASQAPVDVAVVDDRLGAIGGRTVAGWLTRVSEGAPPRLLRLGAPDDHTADVHRPVTASQIADAVAQAAGTSAGSSIWGFSLDADALVVRSDLGEQRLTASEYRLLGALMGAGESGVPSRALAAAAGKASSLRVHVANLRRKLRLATGGGTDVVAGQGRYRLQQGAAH